MQDEEALDVMIDNRLYLMSSRMKRRFDPRGMRKAMEERNEEAKQSSEALLAEIKSGDIDPASENFNQGAAKPEITE